MKLFLIIGKSFSGKNYFLERILEDEEFCKNNNLHRLVESTTRKQREGEVEGKDYYFVSKDDFERDYINRPDIVYTLYKTEYGILYYFIDKSKLDPNKNYIGITNVEVLEKLKEDDDLKKCIQVIYLVPPNYELLSRFSNRKENEEYSDNKYKEIYRRFIDDIIKFSKFSNKYLCGVRSIINVGKEVNFDLIKTMITVGINPIISESVIMDSEIMLSFDYNYRNCFIPENITEDDFLYGKIIIANGKIVINSEKETFYTNN